MGGGNKNKSRKKGKGSTQFKGNVGQVLVDCEEAPPVGTGIVVVDIYSGWAAEVPPM
jgi:hypothetical protein